MTTFKTWLEEEKPNPLDGLRNDVARRKVHELLSGVADGIYSDDNWEGVRKVWDRLTEYGISWTLISSEYGMSPSFQQTFTRPWQRKDGGSLRRINDFKQWKFEIKFTNNNQRETTLYGTIVASGAGSVEDPLDKYDVTVNVS